mmetsp:Transcript_12087/g.13601  ORF Transcript_12087/g.13601 Transcript_12087/m.13601 type:complete len:146 (+) Transcript_12087:36-473(+)
MDLIKTKIRSVASGLGVNMLPVQVVQILSNTMVRFLGFGQNPETALKDAAVDQFIMWGVDYLLAMIGASSFGPIAELFPPIALAWLRVNGPPAFRGGLNRGFLPTALAALGSMQVSKILIGEESYLMGPPSVTTGPYSDGDEGAM